jgi:hypothetical protein
MGSRYFDAAAPIQTARRRERQTRRLLPPSFGRVSIGTARFTAA